MLCVVSQGFERESAGRPHELVDHRFEPFHQRAGFFELVPSRMIFESRRHSAGDARKCCHHSTQLVSRLAQPNRVALAQCLPHCDHIIRQPGFEDLAQLFEDTGVATANLPQYDWVEQF